MSKEVKTTKKKTINWTKAQVVGLWSLIIGLSLFFGGMYVGTQATLTSQAHEANVKTQAIEEYKASLKEL